MAQGKLEYTGAPRRGDSGGSGQGFPPHMFMVLPLAPRQLLPIARPWWPVPAPAAAPAASPAAASAAAAAAAAAASAAAAAATTT